jgi:pimeloyl-ACP methyl ester carboxylesterase
MPVLYMVGARSPASSRGVFGLLREVLPRVKVAQFEQLGHMGPVTHPDFVNEAIAAHLGA